MPPDACRADFSGGETTSGIDGLARSAFSLPAWRGSTAVVSFWDIWTAASGCVLPKATAPAVHF